MIYKVYGVASAPGPPFDREIEKTDHSRHMTSRFGSNRCSGVLPNGKSRGEEVDATGWGID